MNWILKLDKTFAKYTFRDYNNKDIEYRKTNKADIEKGDTITYVDLDCKFVYGTVEVQSVNLIKKSSLQNSRTPGMPDWLNETMVFIESNYKNEKVLVEIITENHKRSD